MDFCYLLVTFIGNCYLWTIAGTITSTCPSSVHVATVYVFYFIGNTHK